MRIIDLHCYPNTQPWIDCQGPYVRALAEYWDREWKAKEEDDVIAEFTGSEPPLPGRILLLDEAGRVVFFHDRGYSASAFLRLLEVLDLPTP